MGTRFRKSVKLPGGGRVNLSKSGVGGSIGRKGIRVTKTASGSLRATTSIPGTGMSYVSDSGSASGRKKRGHGLYDAILSAALIVIVVCSTILLFASCTGGSGQEDAPPLPPAESTPAVEIVADSELRRTGREYLTNLGYDVVSTKETDRRIEFVITLSNLSELDPDSPPDDWEDIRASILDAAIGLSSSMGSTEKSVVLQLQDDTGANLLSVLNGEENYNLFAARDEAPSSNDSVVIVWIVDGGSKYHLDPDCSNMKDSYCVRKSYAVENGYTACSKCAK